MKDARDKGDIAVKVEGLGKMFNLNMVPHLSLREAAGRRLDRIKNHAREAVRKMRAGHWPWHRQDDADTREFWALRDVSFEVRYGEVMGIIGRNGSGKSTLLKILSQVVAPTEGKAELFGRVGALLEVGTGFNPELSGRENIYLYGSVLGMDRSGVKRRFDEIVDFASIEQFLEEPVKHYSSGMYSRLAFSVAAHLECDILLVDEVLSVGDATFTTKCLDKMRELTGQGRAVLFVSHSLSAVDSMCDSGIVLTDGRINFAGPADEALEHYMQGVRLELSRTGHDNPASFPPDPSEPVQFKNISIRNEAGEITNVFNREERAVVVYEVTVRQPIPNHVCSLAVNDEKNNTLIYSFDGDKGSPLMSILQPGDHSFSITLPAKLFKTGRYFITPCLEEEGRTDGHREKHINHLVFMVESTQFDTDQMATKQRSTLVAPDILWKKG